MADMWQVSEAVSLAMHTMVFLAQEPERKASTKRIAEQFGFSHHHLAKIHQRLTRQQLLKTIRGPHGGVELAKKPHEISLLDIYETLEGPMSCATCTLEEPTCGRHHCIFGDLLVTVNTQIRDYFATTTLADLIEKKLKTQQRERYAREQTGGKQV